MARKSNSVAKHKIPEIAASLKAKAAIPITVTVEDTISQLAGPIQAMLAAGYTYTDVAEVFKSSGVEIAASTIQSYHRKQSKSSVAVATAGQRTAGEISPVTTDDDRGAADESMNGFPSNEDEDIPASRDSDPAPANASSEEDLDSSIPKPNPKRAKSSSPQPTPAKSPFNVMDRNKL